MEIAGTFKFWPAIQPRELPERAKTVEMPEYKATEIITRNISERTSPESNGRYEHCFLWKKIPETDVLEKFGYLDKFKADIPISLK